MLRSEFLEILEEVVVSPKRHGNDNGRTRPLYRQQGMTVSLSESIPRSGCAPLSGPFPLRLIDAEEIRSGWGSCGVSFCIPLSSVSAEVGARDRRNRAGVVRRVLGMALGMVKQI
jgi:hypothetical protein